MFTHMILETAQVLELLLDSDFGLGFFKKNLRTSVLEKKNTATITSLMNDSIVY